MYIVTLVLLVSILFIGCSENSKGSYSNILREREGMVLTHINKIKPDEEKYCFMQCNDIWNNNQNLIDTWNRLYSKLGISKLIFVLEVGNASWPYYRCRSIVKIKGDHIVLDINFENLVDSATINYIYLDEQEINIVLSELESRFKIFGMVTDSITQVVDDVSCGFCFVDFHDQQNSFLIYDLPHSLSSHKRRLISYIDSLLAD
jgi:hypothetical protein